MKKKFFYFECSTVRGKLIIAVEVDALTFGNLIDAESDVKRFVLDPCETVIGQVVRKPIGLTWETFRNKEWCLAGYKKGA